MSFTLTLEPVYPLGLVLETQGEQAVVNAQPSAELALAAIIGTAGVIDTGGSVAVTVSYPAAQTVTRGTPVCLFGGQIFKATCVPPYNEVIGLAYDAVIPASGSGRVQTDGLLTLTQPEWEAATGLAGALAAESTYFLQPAGGMAPFVPAADGQVIAPVGYAVSASEFCIDIDTQIQL